ncbi:MAG: PEP/pyruvate-binding domain-containing protein [Humidesulfovibrio sp.]|nr:PEP/pyruvate-binding domain-containing protein [Humidesulfovibrio sp.]
MGFLSRILSRWGQAIFFPEGRLRDRYEAFKALLAADEQSLLLVAELEEIFSGARQVDPARINWLCGQLSEAVGNVVARLLAMHPGGYPGLAGTLARIRLGLAQQLPPRLSKSGRPFVLPLAQALGRPETAGGKAANLAAVQRAGLPVPPGLVVTTGAFQHFLTASGLQRRLERLLRQVDLSRPDRVGPLCVGMQALVLGASVPEDLARALREAVAGSGFAGRRLAVRSSAVAEDGERSFAGQYTSELDVPPEHIVEAYRRVVASKYRPRAVTYRVTCGLPDECAPMAVLVLPMVRATAAGVLHSCESAPGKAGQCVSIFASAGLADALVSGTSEARTYRLSRRLPAQILDVSGDADVELGQTELSELVMIGLVLQSVFGRPQEVEWARDPDGRCYVLQSRNQSAPQSLKADQEVVWPDDAEALGGSGARALAEGLNPIAPGVGCGAVFHLGAGDDIARVPAGAVLAVDCLTPTLARGTDRVVAVVARSGCRASHFASVAREARVPVVSGLKNIRARLPEGLLVTVDGDAGRILAGCSAALRDAPAKRMEEQRKRLAERFAALARQTCHLGLTDPEAPDFRPEGCHSLHDLVRFCHERAVAEMVGPTENGGTDARPDRGLGKARRLRTGLAFTLFLLDLGGGLAPASGRGDEVRPEDIASAPMRALWQGLACSGETWADTGFCCDWAEFDRVSAGIFRKDSRLLASYGLLSADYLHLLVRFGYHFAMLDCLCGPRAEANYICFRFMGGGGLPEQRRRRASVIATVLEGSGFVVRVRGDMLNARLSRAEEADVRRSLIMLGRLLVRTQRLDLRLTDAAQAQRLAEDFLSEMDQGQ